VSNLPFHDRTDFDDADRGLIGSLEPAVVTAADGTVVWDNDAYAFLDADCPPTAHPSLWRQSQLCAKQGLYEVTPGIYQVRGLDLSNMTVVEGDRGVIVIDPLVSMETAAAALSLYRRHRGDRAVTAVIYTHAHVDHFGGVRGVVDAADGDVPDRRPRRLHGVGGVGERVRRSGHGAPRRLHVRVFARTVAGGPDRLRPRSGDIERHGRTAGADRRHHSHRPGADPRRRTDPLSS
jgi:hypothetical protein